MPKRHNIGKADQRRSVKRELICVERDVTCVKRDLIFSQKDFVSMAYVTRAKTNVKRDLEIDLLRSKRDLLTLAYTLQCASTRVSKET